MGSYQVGTHYEAYILIVMRHKWLTWTSYRVLSWKGSCLNPSDFNNSNISSNGTTTNSYSNLTIATVIRKEVDYKIGTLPEHGQTQLDPDLDSCSLNPKPFQHFAGCPMTLHVYCRGVNDEQHHVEVYLRYPIP